jgi:hypothetical protein
MQEMWGASFVVALKDKVGRYRFSVPVTNEPAQYVLLVLKPEHGIEQSYTTGRETKMCVRFSHATLLI